MRDSSLNETEYLIHQIRAFLDAGNYDNEQLSNVTLLMDNICRPDMDSSYPISVNIDVAKYSNVTGKENRCRAIDESLDAMYGVFRRASLNKSEPLDFSSIQFYSDPANKAASYNLTDLINTSWIKSETILEQVCVITNSVKDYVQLRSSNSTAQDRSTQQQVGVLGTVLELIDRILEPLLGLQKRLYWDSNNRVELVVSGLNHGLVSIRDGLSKGYRSTRERIVNVFSSSSNSTSTPAMINKTEVVTKPSINL